MRTGKYSNPSEQRIRLYPDKGYSGIHAYEQRMYYKPKDPFMQQMGSGTVFPTNPRPPPPEEAHRAENKVYSVNRSSIIGKSENLFIR